MVWRFEDLKRTVQIDSPGYVSFPFIGQVQAVGLTQKQLAGKRDKKLTSYGNPKRSP
jgi:protein involved in polysaccharide export with SLBB domain